MTQTKYSRLEIEESIKNTKSNMRENEQMFEHIKKIEISSKKDCDDIKNFFFNSKSKLEGDIVFVKDIQTKIIHKIKEIKDVERKKKEKELKIKLEKERKEIEAARARLAAKLAKEKEMEKEKKEKKEEKKDKKKEEKDKKKDEKKDKKKEEKDKKKEEKNDKKKKDDSFVEKSSNYLTGFIQRIKGYFSFVQLKSAKTEVLSFIEIEKKLKDIKSPEKQINLLVTSQKEFKIVMRSLDEAVIK